MKRKKLVEEVDAVQTFTIVGKKTRRGIVAVRQRVKSNTQAVSRPSTTPSRHATQEGTPPASTEPVGGDDGGSFTPPHSNFKVRN